MSDFLGSLVARHFSPGVAIRPRPVSLFEPAPRARASVAAESVRRSEHRDTQERLELADHDDPVGRDLETIVEVPAPAVPRRRERALTEGCRQQPVREQGVPPARAFDYPDDISAAEIEPVTPPPIAQIAAPSRAGNERLSEQRTAMEPTARSPRSGRTRAEARKLEQAAGTAPQPESPAPATRQDVSAGLPGEPVLVQTLERRVPLPAPVRPRSTKRSSSLAPDTRRTSPPEIEMGEMPLRRAPPSPPLMEPVASPTRPRADQERPGQPPAVPARPVKLSVTLENAPAAATVAPPPPITAVAPALKPAVAPPWLASSTPEPPRWRTAKVTPPGSIDLPGDASPSPVAPPRDSRTAIQVPAAHITIQPQTGSPPAIRPAAQLAPATEPAAPTTITVTIGRIEVKAAPAAAPAANRTRATAPSLTLEEYLRQRASGGNR
jgi:hypothetical protein